MSKILNAESDHYLRAAHRYDDLTQNELEHMRIRGEARMSQSYEPKDRVQGALMQSISAKLLNENFHTKYPTADFTEFGDITMSPCQKTSIRRPLPEVRGMEEDERDNSFSL